MTDPETDKATEERERQVRQWVIDERGRCLLQADIKENKMCKTKCNPDLIDLKLYRAKLDYEFDHDICFMPPPSITEREMPWTNKEFDLMTENREKAIEIYDEYKRIA